MTRQEKAKTKMWRIELVTNDVICNSIEIEAETIEKVDYHNLLIDGVCWQAPKILAMSFAEIKEMEV